MRDRLVVQEQDGRVTVAYQRAGQVIPEPAGAPFEFICPLTAAQRENLRWYLEEYLTAPYAVYEERGQTIQGQLNGWGEALFSAILGRELPAHDAYVRAREHGGAELILSSNSASFLALPWELLKDPDRTEPLALALTSLDRTVSVAAEAAEQANSDDALRVLMVIARPLGVRDVEYQMIARRLLERLDSVRGKVVLDVLRPPTFDALQVQLERAREAGQPYQVLHFDGHGTFGDGANVNGGTHQYDATAEQGYVAFEQDTGGQQLVSAADFASAVNRAEVPLVVLNACRSGTLGDEAVEATVATRLLEGGTASVVAMGYSVYAVAAAEFMEAFYTRLFAGDSVSAAVMAGRRRMYGHKGRPSPKGLLPLDDWAVPVHYLRRSLSFPRLKQTHAAGKPSLDELQTPPEDTLKAVGRFVGRDDAFYELERALRLQRVVVIHGPGGMGKTELAKAFARWWRDSGGVDDPNWILFHAFEPGLASFGLDGVVSAIGLKLFGPEFIVKAKDRTQRQAAVLQALRQYRMLLVWDNFESVYSMPDPTGATPPLGKEERKAVADFLAELVQHGHSGVIITSRNPEDWLGSIHRQKLYGLKPQGAAELAEDVLAPYSWNRERRAERAYAELLEWFDGHPLSLRLMLPQLERMGAGELLAALRGEAKNLPSGFEGDAGEGRLASLGASVKYSFDHLQAELRERLPALGLFEGVVDEDVLAIFSTVDGVPARFAGIKAWTETLQALTGVGLLAAVGGGMYALHPALPAYLAAEWGRLAGDVYEVEHTAAQHSLLEAYAVFSRWLSEQIGGPSGETAVALLERQRRTMGRLVGLALQEGRFEAAQALLQPLNVYWDLRGLGQEARGWVDRCRDATEGPDGTPPDFDGAAGALWLFMVGVEARRSRDAGNLDAAEAALRLICERLQNSSAGLPDQRLANAYNELGIVAQGRGDLTEAELFHRKALEIGQTLSDQQLMATGCLELGNVMYERRYLKNAEEWYRKSVEMAETLSDRRMLATSYHQLGMVTQDRDYLEEAGQLYRKALDIEKALHDLPGMAKSYHELGIVAQKRHALEEAEQWHRKALEIKETLRNRRAMTSTYHQLGMVMQQRGDLPQAEQWYRKALGIEEELGDRVGMANSYGQLGLLAEQNQDPAAALDCVVRCVALFEQFPHPATGPGPRHLARLTAQLGMAALASSWQRQTGQPLPQHVRSAVEEMIK